MMDEDRDIDDNEDASNACLLSVKQDGWQSPIRRLPALHCHGVTPASAAASAGCRPDDEHTTAEA